MQIAKSIYSVSIYSMVLVESHLIVVTENHTEWMVFVDVRNVACKCKCKHRHTHTHYINTTHTHNKAGKRSKDRWTTHHHHITRWQCSRAALTEDDLVAMAPAENGRNGDHQCGTSHVECISGSNYTKTRPKHRGRA